MCQFVLCLSHKHAHLDAKKKALCLRQCPNTSPPPLVMCIARSKTKANKIMKIPSGFEGQSCVPSLSMYGGHGNSYRKAIYNGRKLLSSGNIIADTWLQLQGLPCLLRDKHTHCQPNTRECATALEQVHAVLDWKRSRCHLPSNATNRNSAPQAHVLPVMLPRAECMRSDGWPLGPF